MTDNTSPNGQNGRSSKVEIEEQTGFDHASDVDYALRRAKTTGAVSISAELFEKLYLSPKNEVSGQLRKTFGNPTPIGLIGFLLALSPLSCSLMGWRGADSGGSALIPDYFFLGGLLLVIAGILEWVLGNSFPAVVFLTFAGYWLSFGATLNPSFAAYSSYASAGQPAATGLQAQGFNASFAFLQVFMGVACFCFLLGSLRTNLCFVIIFFTLLLAFALLSAAYWYLAEDYTGNAAKVGRYLVAAGAVTFVTCLSGWWIFLAIVLESVDFPISLPVGDLSRYVQGRSHRLAARGAREKGEV